MTLELKLMQDLEFDQKMVIANLVSENHAPERTRINVEGFFNPKRPLSYDGLDIAVIVAALNNDKVVGFYESTFFGLDNGVLENTLPGYLNVESKGQGIGSEIIDSMGTIFQELGYVTGVPVVHTIGSIDETTMYANMSYESIGTGQKGEWQQLHMYQKTFLPQHQELVPNQQRIVDSMSKRIQKYNTLELKLFEDLDEKLQYEAAEVVARSPILSPGEERRMGPNEISEGYIDEKLEGLKDDSDLYVIVVGIEDGKVVAMYEMTPFRQTGEGNLRNADVGNLHAYPREEGVGDRFMKALGPILETVASRASSELEHNVNSAPGTLFPRHGYDNHGDIDNIGKNDYSRVYSPHNHALGSGQESIVQGFLKSIPTNPT